jgi:hypothetical protein
MTLKYHHGTDSNHCAMEADESLGTHTLDVMEVRPVNSADSTHTRTTSWALDHSSWHLVAAD